jgi:predicted O-methyltransferase YrrM
MKEKISDINRIATSNSGGIEKVTIRSWGEVINDAIDKGLQYKPQQHRVELFNFLEYCIKRNVKTVLEIGSYDGGLTFIFSELFEKVIAIDIKHRIHFERPNVKRITMNTQTTDARSIQELMGIRFDLIFIDGDHSEVGVTNDYVQFKKLLSPNGIMAFHDIKESKGHIEHECFVHNFWKNVKEGKKIIEFIDSGNTWMADINPKYKDRMGEFGGIGVYFND